jgi:hypothetical protein
MRIITTALIWLFCSHLAQADVEQGMLCGLFRATVYAPVEGQGHYVFASPKAVSKTKLIMPKDFKLPTDDLDRLLEITFRLEGPCFRECEVTDVKIVKRVSSLDFFPPFYRGPSDLVKAEKCKN